MAKHLILKRLVLMFLPRIVNVYFDVLDLYLHKTRPKFVHIIDRKRTSKNDVF